MRRVRAVIRCALAAGAIGLVATGCSVNPATGQRQLALIGEQQEIAMGQGAHDDVRAQFGVYPDEELQRYVAELGRRLAQGSERPQLPWDFTVVDDPIVNAFALPGGFIYLSRGILAHFNSEAEMVSVLGHEIGHVTARHSVEQMSKQQLAGLGLGVAMIASETARAFGDLASAGMQMLFLKFSRDDERQADDLGLRYLVSAGYDPREMPRVFETLDRMSTAAEGGRVPAWQSTHPDPGQRAERIRAEIGALGGEPQRGRVERAAYLRRLAGLVYGDDPRQGYFVDNRFYHPELEFQLELPPEWKTVNQRQAVGAISPGQDAITVLTLAEGDPETAAQTFFSQSGIEAGSRWRPGFRFFRTTPGEQGYVQGLVGFLTHGGRTYRLLGYARGEQFGGYQRILERTLGSFARLSERRYLEVQPGRLQILELPAAMTIEDVHRRFGSSIDAGTLAILNGVPAAEELPAGTLVKRVAGGELPR